MRNFLEEYGMARLDEVCDFLFDEYDIVTSTLSRARVGLGRTHGLRVGSGFGLGFG